MKTCESCVHWVEFDYTNARNPPAVPRGWCESRDPRVPEGEGPGGLCPRADFGCVAHEPKLLLRYHNPALIPADRVTFTHWPIGLGEPRGA